MGQADRPARLRLVPSSTPDPEAERQLGARDVGEYVYCPRLFYFMAVEGVMLHNAHTAKGLAIHQRVDQPSLASSAGDVDLRRVRSLTLSSAALGLTAVLDVAVVRGKTAIPIEYRKGKPDHRGNGLPADSDEIEPQGRLALGNPIPWPTDLVQVALQAILLREAGYEVPEALLWYAAERRQIAVPITDDLCELALEALRRAHACAVGPRPLPLLDDPRCVGCSLQPHCLPDEVHHQRRTRPELRPRSVWPPRDDGVHLVAQSQAARIGVRGEALQVFDRDGVRQREIPLASVESLTVIGMVQLSTQALHTLARMGVTVAFATRAGRAVTVLDPLDSTSALVRTSQVTRLAVPAARLEVCRALVAAKITNQRTILMRNARELPDDVPRRLALAVRSAMRAPTVDSLRGTEGAAAALYFEHLPRALGAPWNQFLATNGRARRPPPDPVNATLSFGYSMLANECVAAARLARLEPSIGAYHVHRPGRPACALDLMEPFRPLIADSIALLGFNRGEFREGHFTNTAAGWNFTEAGMRAFFDLYDRRMRTEVTHPVFGYRLSYRRMITLHARMLAAWLVGDVPDLRFLTTR